MSRTLTEMVRDAREAGAPLVYCATSDQLGALAELVRDIPAIAHIGWDAIKGCYALAGQAEAALAKIDVSMTVNPQSFLEAAANFPRATPDAPGKPGTPGTVVFMLNAHRFIEDPFVSTGVLSLRERYKTSQRTLIMLGASIELPVEHRQDVIVIDAPLPNDEQLKEQIVKLVTAQGLPAEWATSKVVDAVRGLSPFAAETVVSMALRTNRIDTEALWENKRTRIRQIKGLSLLTGGQRFAGIGGNAELVKYARKMMAGKEEPRAIYLWDEIEKYMVGASGAGADGISADYLGVGLREMEDNGLDGMLLLSPPGCGKTQFMQALALEYGIPGVKFDFGAMKGRYVGDSETAVREAFKAAHAISGGRALVVGTCNRIEVLPAEFRRRFTKGIWFVDLPTEQERLDIWKIQLAAHGLSPENAAEGVKLSHDWTGAEIRNACREAYRMNLSIAEACEQIVPVIQSDPESIGALRFLAHNRLRSANRPGKYQSNTVETDVPLGVARRIAPVRES